MFPCSSSCGKFFLFRSMVAQLLNDIQSQAMAVYGLAIDLGQRARKGEKGRPRVCWPFALSITKASA